MEEKNVGRGNSCGQGSKQQHSQERGHGVREEGSCSWRFLCGAMTILYSLRQTFGNTLPQNMALCSGGFRVRRRGKGGRDSACCV